MGRPYKDGTPSKPNERWTEEEVKRLLELRAAGHSYTQIGSLMGKERGSVSSKLHRLDATGKHRTLVDRKHIETLSLRYKG